MSSKDYTQDICPLKIERNLPFLYDSEVFESSVNGSKWESCLTIYHSDIHRLKFQSLRWSHHSRIDNFLIICHFLFKFCINHFIWFSTFIENGIFLGLVSWLIWPDCIESMCIHINEQPGQGDWLTTVLYHWAISAPFNPGGSKCHLYLLAHSLLKTNLLSFNTCLCLH